MIYLPNGWNNSFFWFSAFIQKQKNASIMPLMDIHVICFWFTIQFSSFCTVWCLNSSHTKCQMRWMVLALFWLQFKVAIQSRWQRIIDFQFIKNSNFAPMDFSWNMKFQAIRACAMAPTPAPPVSYLFWNWTRILSCALNLDSLTPEIKIKSLQVKLLINTQNCAESGTRYLFVYHKTQNTKRAIPLD